MYPYQFSPIRMRRPAYAPTLVTPPAVAVLTLEEVKAQLVVDAGDDDILIQGLIDAAISYLDGPTGVLGRCLSSQTWRQDFDLFDCELELPLAPVTSIDSVKYDDPSGTEQTVDPANYRLLTGGRGSFVRFKAGFTFPSLSVNYPSVRVQYVVGYAATNDTPPKSTVPAAIKNAIKLLVAHWYENRETVVVGRGAAAVEVPFAVSTLLAPFRRIQI